MDETEMNDSSKVPNDYVVQGPAEVQNTEISNLIYDMSSSKLHLMNSNQEQGDHREPPLYSDTYLLGRSINKPSSWKLEINPCHMENGLQCISMHLCMCSLYPPAEHVDVTYELQIVEAYWGKIAHRKESGIRRLSKENPSFGWTNFLPINKLGTKPPDVIKFRAKVALYSDPMPLLLPPIISLFKKREAFYKRAIIASFDSSLTKGNNSTKSVQFTEMSSEDAELFNKEEEIREHVANLWLLKSKCDGQVVVKDHIIPVHISVLKAKSPVFNNHFSKLNSSGNRLKRLVINNFEKEVVEAALEFCYTKMITKVFANLSHNFELLEAAEQLSINGLKDFAIEMILASVNVNSFECIYQMMVEDRLADGEEFSIGQFLKLLLEQRRQNRRLLSDFRKNVSTYASLIFE